MARKKAKKRAKKRTHHPKKKAHRTKKRHGGKMPLKVLEHLAAGAVQAVQRRGGKVQRHTKAELKRARK